MTDICEIIKAASCDSLHCTVDNGTNKYLCFTRLDTHFVICASDSVDLWIIELDFDELDVLRDISNMNMDAYLSCIREGFTFGNVQVSQVGVKVNLVVGTGNKSTNFDLYEAKAMDKKTEFQHILFRLAEKSFDLEQQLEKANTELIMLKKQKGIVSTSSNNLGIDLDSGKMKNQPKAPPKQQGMSVINPSSKKRKVAKGITYD